MNIFINVARKIQLGQTHLQCVRWRIVVIVFYSVSYIIIIHLYTRLYIFFSHNRLLTHGCTFDRRRRRC